MRVVASPSSIGISAVGLSTIGALYFAVPAQRPVCSEVVVQQQQFQPPAGRDSAPGSAKPRYRVLVVEDDRHTSEALRSLLGQEGFDATVYFNGSDALRNLDGQKFDAVLIDVHLPDMNGLVLSQQLRKTLGTGVPIMVVSGDTSMETLNSLSHVGATYFLAKPVNPQLLLEQLRSHVTGKFRTMDCD